MNDDCVFCKAKGPHPVTLKVPIATRNLLIEPACCEECWDILWIMLQDVPWLRYQITQYQSKARHRNYNIEGCWVGGY